MSVGKPHIAISDHARRRFAERYRLGVTADDLRRMVACIQRGEAVLLKADAGENRAVYATPRPSRRGKQNKLAPVVYDRKFDAIVTVLPENNLWPYRRVISKFREQRLAERGPDAWPLKLSNAGAPANPDVRLILDANRLYYHVVCKPSVCPFPVSLYVRDIGRTGWGRREIVYLKANGFSANGFGSALELLKQQFKTCLAVRTGNVPPEAPALTEAFINKLARATKEENLSWAGLFTPVRAIAA